MCTIAITGHRPDKLDKDWYYVKPRTQQIRSEMERIITENNCTKLITGMALGIDTIAAHIAITFKIPFIAAVPFHGQEMKWPKKSQSSYYDLLCNAERVVYIYDDKNFRPDNVRAGYLNLLFQSRNQWMVDQLEPGKDLLLSVWDGTNGGTRNCVKYAERRISRPRMINIDPNTLQVTLLP